LLIVTWWLQALSHESFGISLSSFDGNTGLSLEALRNALYKCKTYLLTYLLTLRLTTEGHQEHLLWDVPRRP